MKFSAISLFANALSGHKKWPSQFPNKEPKKEYLFQTQNLEVN